MKVTDSLRSQVQRWRQSRSCRLGRESRTDVRPRRGWKDERRRPMSEASFKSMWDGRHVTPQIGCYFLQLEYLVASYANTVDARQQGTTHTFGSDESGCLSARLLESPCGLRSLWLQRCPA